jgi:cell division control protein 6
MISGGNENIYGIFIDKSSSIFQDENFLDKGYYPNISEILHRGKEMEMYIRHLSKILKNVVPENLFIYGKMGTGKTMVTKVLTAQLEKEASPHGIKVKTVYIHCKTKPTNIGVLKCINDSIGLEISGYKIKTTNSFDAYFSRFCKLAKDYNGYLIIILDEVDNLADPDILNVFARVKESGFLDRNVTIIGITNDVRFDETLDARTRSILSQKDIIFPPYDANQLRDILQQRAELAFKQEVLEDTVLPLCAAYAAHDHGDARKALELLRYSGNIAEEQKENKVTEQHVITAKGLIERDKITEIIRTLPTQLKIVLASCLINLSKETSCKSHTGEIYNTYKDLCTRIGIEITTQRRVTDLISELSTLGIINAVEKSKGRHGRTKEVTLAVTAKVAWSVLMEDYRLISLKDINVFRQVEQNQEAELVQMNLKSFK